jgi:uncharacterized membrane protein (DUF4010 family)
MDRITPQVGAVAIALAPFSNVIAKAIYAAFLGSTPVRLQFGLASLAAIVATAIALYFTMG